MSRAYRNARRRAWAPAPEGGSLRRPTRAGNSVAAQTPSGNGQGRGAPAVGCTAAYAKTPRVSNSPFSTAGESLYRSHSSIIVA